MALLEIEGLTVEFPTDDGVVKAVDDLSYTLDADEVLGIVGESGSGKSVSAMAVMGLLPRSAKVRGSVKLRGEELLGVGDHRMQTVRGSEVAIVFQDALTALNPVYKVGDQIAEAVTCHDRHIDKHTLGERVVGLLELVGIPQPKHRAEQYPHEYSGGMRQRAMIAMAIANDPAVLIADEPTTALDVTIQAQVLDVLERIQERTGSAIIMITHDLGVVAGMADRVLVMYAGRLAEIGAVDDIFYNTGHPYTLSLLASLPRIDRESGSNDRLFRIEGNPPSLINVPPGCPFHPRCFRAELPAPCSTERPSPAIVQGVFAHRATCHFAAEVAALTPEELQTWMRP